MDITGLGSVFDLGKTVIERIWPDANKRAEEMRKLEELKQQGDLAQLNAHVQLLLGQLEVNKIEAANKSLFVAGWRPAVGWICGISLGYSVLVYGLLMWLWKLLQASGAIPAEMEPPPPTDLAAIMPILLGMLGLGTMRSFDKKQGTQTDKL